MAIRYPHKIEVPPIFLSIERSYFSMVQDVDLYLNLLRNDRFSCALLLFCDKYNVQVKRGDELVFLAIIFNVLRSSTKSLLPLRPECRKMIHSGIRLLFSIPINGSASSPGVLP